MFADAGIFAGNDLVSNARGFVAGGTDDLNFAGVQRHFLSDDAAVGNFQTGLAVAFDFVDAFDDDFAGGGHGADNFALLALIFAAEDDNGIALLDVKFNERQLGTSFRLEHFGRERNNFHEIFFAQFAGDGSENTRAARRKIVLDYDGGVLVETDIGAVGAAQTFF